MKTKTKKNELTVEARPVEGTPFTAIKHNSEITLTLGKWNICKVKFTDWEEIPEYIEKNKWELIGAFASIVAEEMTKNYLINNQKLKQ